MAETKNILLRLDPDLADRLQAVATVEGLAVSDVVREAIADHIRRRQKTPAFRRMVRESLDRHRHLIELLEEDEGQ